MLYHKIQILEKDFQELPQFVQEHSERVGRYTQILMGRMEELQKQAAFLSCLFRIRIKSKYWADIMISENSVLPMKFGKVPLPLAKHKKILYISTRLSRLTF